MEGFITGQVMQVIPWGSLVKDPHSWMSRECTPEGFEWKDPSKIQIGEIFRLLDHWRDRQDQGHVPLVWVPSCPIFQDAQPSERIRKLRESRTAIQPPESDEEIFVLPQSDDIDEDEDVDDPEIPGAVERSLPFGHAFERGFGEYFIHIL
jgi:hypothetical protein